jgi:8-oxo-dGTP pyrophosphatase MutT (NUDIX family)
MTDPTARAVRLTTSERNQDFPNLRPRDAATLIILDRAGGEPRILLGRRHHGHKFLPGKFVFPGGRVEPTDGRMNAASELDPVVERTLMRQMQRPSRSRARAMALACIRETYEETGLMIGTRQAGPVAGPVVGPIAASAGPWADFAAAGVAPDLAALHFVARAITPPRRPKRFDTRFFAIDAEAIVERRDGIVGPDSELTELVWVPLAEAPALGLMTVTLVVLEELTARIAAGMPRDMPVPFYRMMNQKFVHDGLSAGPDS